MNGPIKNILNTGQKQSCLAKAAKDAALPASKSGHSNMGQFLHKQPSKGPLNKSPGQGQGNYELQAA